MERDLSQRQRVIKGAMIIRGDTNTKFAYISQVESLILKGLQILNNDTNRIVSVELINKVRKLYFYV